MMISEHCASLRKYQGRKHRTNTVFFFSTKFSDSHALTLLIDELRIAFVNTEFFHPLHKSKTEIQCLVTAQIPTIILQNLP